MLVWKTHLEMEPCKPWLSSFPICNILQFTRCKTNMINTCSISHHAFTVGRQHESQTLIRKYPGGRSARMCADNSLNGRLFDVCCSLSWFMAVLSSLATHFSSWLVLLKWSKRIYGSTDKTDPTRLKSCQRGNDLLRESCTECYWNPCKHCRKDHFSCNREAASWATPTLELHITHLIIHQSNISHLKCSTR